jgi:acyl-CoA synthetase (NDP forming)
LLTPRSIAFVGASPSLGAPGNQMILEARRGGFAGAMYPVNPKYDEVEGLRCYPSLADLPEAADMAILAVANHRLEKQVANAAACGTRAAVIFASGYLEGDSDPPLLDRLARRAREAEMQICGGNCMGFYNLEACVWAGGYRAPGGLVRGGVTYISHSGSAMFAMMDYDNRLAYNLVVSSGQEIVTSAADYMDFALDLESTRVIVLFLEAVRNADRFIAALEKAQARDVPVVALKVGSTDASAKFALSHSGAIAGSDTAFQAVCDRYGVLRAASLDELAATASLLAMPHRVASGGLAAILDSGGQRELLVDLASDIGVPFSEISDETTTRLAARLDHGLDPVNPCDAWGTGHDYENIFADCFSALVKDPDTAIGILFADIRIGHFLHDAYLRACSKVAAECDKPVAIATFMNWARYGDLARRLVEAGVTVLDGVEPTLRAVRHALAYRDFRARQPSKPPPAAPEKIDARWRRRLAAGGVLDEAEGLTLLADFGVPTLACRVADDREGAIAAAEALGYPVAMKTAAPEIHHKSDVGGVKLGIADRDALAAAFDDLAARLGPRVVISPMAVAGVEIALGVTVDAQFGPLVMVGAGGVLVELLRDSRFALAPFDAGSAGRLVDGLRVRTLLDGVRGAPAADIGALAEAVSRISVLAAALGDVLQEIDVNPLIVGPEGCVAVDALVVARTTAAAS